MFKRILACVVGVFTLSIADCQVMRFPDIAIPPDVLAKYPYLKSDFEFVDVELDDGMVGYFTFKLEKACFNEDIRSRLFNGIDAKLRANNFYQDDCWLELNCGPNSVKKIQGHTLLQRAATPTINEFHYHNFNLSVELMGHYRVYPYEVRRLWFIPIGCDEKPAYNTGDFILLTGSCSNNIYFTLQGSNLVINNTLDVGGSCLERCNKPSTPYNAARNIILPSEVTSTPFDLTSAGSDWDGLMRIFMQDTQSINISEDNDYYYVYCLKYKI